MISERIRKVVNTRPSDYMIASDHARSLDMLQFANSRNVEFQPDTCFEAYSLVTYLCLLIQKKLQQYRNCIGSKGCMYWQIYIYISCGIP